MTSAERRATCSDAPGSGSGTSHTRRPTWWNWMPRRLSPHHELPSESVYASSSGCRSSPPPEGRAAARWKPPLCSAANKPPIDASSSNASTCASLPTCAGTAGRDRGRSAQARTARGGGRSAEVARARLELLGLSLQHGHRLLVGPLAFDGDLRGGGAARHASSRATRWCEPEAAATRCSMCGCIRAPRAMAEAWPREIDRDPADAICRRALASPDPWERRREGGGRGGGRGVGRAPARRVSAVPWGCLCGGAIRPGPTGGGVPRKI